MRARLAGISAETARAAARAVAARVVGLPGLADVSRVGLYAALPDELPSEPLFEALRALDKRCCFPRCRDDGRLEFAPVERFDELASGRYGLLEPETAAEPIGSEDWVIVPGLAFDEEGGRLGRGRAFYDRTFPAGAPGPRRIGVGYGFQRVERVPREAHDRAVDWVVTERGVHVPGRGPRQEKKAP